MIVRALAAVGALLGLQAILLLADAGTDGASHGSPAAGPPGRSSAAPAGDPCRRRRPTLDAYTRLVMDNFIDTQPPRLVVNPDPAPGVPLVTLARPIEPQALQYALRSHLMEDIEASRTDPSIWTIGNGRVIGLVPWRYASPGPFASAAEREPVLFRPLARGAAGAVIAFASQGAAPAFALAPFGGPLASGDPRIARLDLPSASAAFPVGPAPAVHLYCGGAPGWTAEVRRVGDQAAVRVTGGACRVEVDGVRVADFAPLAPRARLTLIDAQGRAFAFQRLADGQSDQLSASAASGGRSLSPDALVWGRSVDDDLLRAATDCAAAGAPRRSAPPVQVSLDGPLQTQVQAALDGFLARRFAGGQARPLLAAATVMDARTGEVLAMASSPRPRSLIDLDAADPEQRRAWETDANLKLLPIGSAAKPLLAASILAWRPALGDLVTPPKQGPVTDVLGVQFQSPIPGDSKGARVGFDDFIKNSDNYYAGSLLLLASADPASSDQITLAPGERYGLCPGGGACPDRLQRPKSVFEQAGTNGASVPAQPESLTALGWIGVLHDLFDAQTSARSAADPNSPYAFPGCSGGASRYGGQSRDASVWRGLLDTRGDLDPCGFSQSTPQREALGLEQARDYRRDMLTVILGNGEGRWSAVKLAEAYARLATGHQVRASFVYAPDPDGAFHALPLLSVDPGLARRADLDAARRKVTHAMTLVPQGTAFATDLRPQLQALQARLAAVAPPGGPLILGAFAKTGTPALAEANFSPADLAINRLLAQGRVLGWDTRHVFVIDGGEAIPLSADRTAAAAAARSRAVRRLEEDAELRLGPRLAGEVVRRLVADNVALDRREHPFILSRDGRVLVQVSPALEEITTPDKSSGKVMAVVVAAYGPGATSVGSDGRALDASGEPSCAFAVVVNFEFPIQSEGNSAADFAAQIIRDQLADRLVACRARG